MHKKKGFSFLEMLIVIMIMSILFITFRSVFQIKNKDLLYGQACIETIYGEINNFMYAGLSSKSVNSGGTQIFPDQYSILFTPGSGTITLGYQEQQNEHIYSTIVLSGNTMNYCASNSYTIKMTGDTYGLYINKGLQENSDMKTFYLSGANIGTGANIFLQCDTSGTGCKTMARFETDTRTIGLKKQMCLTFTGSDCSEWDN